MTSLLHALDPAAAAAAVLAGLLLGWLGAWRLLFRRRLEAELRRAEQRYRELSEMMPQVVFETDRRGVITYANSHAFSLMGYEPADLERGIRVVDLVVPEHRDLASRNLHRRLEGGDTAPAEYTMRTRDGERFPALVYAQRRVRSGQVLGLRGVVVDIHERRLSEELFQGVFENAPYAIVVAEIAEARIRMVNPAFERLSGHPASALVGRRPEEIGLIPAPETARYLEKLEREGVLRDVRTHITCRAGEKKHVTFSASVNREAGRPYILAILVDVTEDVLFRERLLKLAAAVENADEDVILTDTQGRIQYVNTAFERITGFRREEVLGRNPRLLKSGRHDQPFYARLWSTILRGETWRGRLTNRRRDGALVIEDASITGVYDADGNRIGFVSVKRDVTEEVRLEQRISQAQKMEAIGTLAGGIAHDFNNILSAILGYAELAQEDLPEGAAAHRSIAKVLTAGHRARDLVSQILTFSRQGGQAARPLRLRPVVAEVLRLLRATLPSTIAIHADLRSDALVEADPTQIHQIVMNLCTNSAHAMRESGGALTVSLDEVEIDGAAAAGVDLLPGPHVRLRIQDTGHGIEPALQERIFEPFFTTKRQGEGTGLGLSVVHGIVQQHRGRIEVESAPGVGTTFEVLLPVLRDAVSEAEAGPEGSAPIGRERILFVDDEAPQRELAAEGLSRLGYTVETAADGATALGILARDPEGFAVVVTDMTMPGMTGDVLAARLREMRPGLPILLCTGFSERLEAGRAGDLPVSGVVHKPLSARELARHVRDLLDR